MATCVIRLSLTVLPFHTVHRLTRKLVPASAENAGVNRIAWAANSAARFIPKSNCLVRALSAQALLLRHGFSSRLTIGVKKDSSDRFAAHAWVTCGDGAVVGGPDARNYTSLLSLES